MGISFRNGAYQNEPWNEEDTGDNVASLVCRSLFWDGSDVSVVELVYPQAHRSQKDEDFELQSSLEGMEVLERKN